MAPNNNPLYLMLGGTYPVLLFATFFVVSNMGAIPPLSLESFFSPFTGPEPLLAFALAGFAFFDMAWYHLSLFPQCLPDPKKHLILIVLPEVFAVFGLAIGVFYMNPWAATPFVVLGFANYAYAFIRTQGTSQSF